jgi:hypothetical protein
VIAPVFHKPGRQHKKKYEKNADNDKQMIKRTHDPK